MPTWLQHGSQSAPRIGSGSHVAQSANATCQPVLGHTHGNALYRAHHDASLAAAQIELLLGPGLASLLASIHARSRYNKTYEQRPRASGSPARSGYVCPSTHR